MKDKLTLHSARLFSGSLIAVFGPQALRHLLDLSLRLPLSLPLSQSLTLSLCVSANPDLSALFYLSFSMAIMRN